MRLKTWICTALFTLIFSTSALAGINSVQVVSFSQETMGNLGIELTGKKVITEDFSFKFPESWDTPCVLVPSEHNYEIYKKEAYEADGSGLLFSIQCYEDASMEELNGCSVLGFCGNRAYVLISAYEDLAEDENGEFYNACRKAAATMKKSFVAYIRE